MTDNELLSDLGTFADIIEEEHRLLRDLIPEAAERMWTTSPVPRPRDEDARGIVGDTHSDPTADVALDPRRMAVRDSIVRSREALRDAAVALRGVRRGMERNIDWYDGTDTP